MIASIRGLVGGSGSELPEISGLRRSDSSAGGKARLMSRSAASTSTVAKRCSNDRTSPRAGQRRAPLCRRRFPRVGFGRSEEHTSELQSLRHLVCRLLLEKKKKN